MITYRQPFRGEWPISQEYGVIVPDVTYKGKPHTGIDYACPTGTEILASADGQVMAASFDGSGYGNRVIILHPDKKATLYAHLSKMMVTPRQEVKQGDVIGLSGNSGYTTGPHLHFEARKIWWDFSTDQNPVTFLPLMCVADPVEVSDVQEGGQTPQGGICPQLTAGVYRVACEAAYVRNWETLNREKLVYRGERVYVFGESKVMDKLRFYYTGTGSAMAAVDCEGTVILEKFEV